MRNVPLLLSTTILCTALSAQNWVSNGDFANGLTGWTETGYSAAPGVETFDVTGLGATTCYGAGHGGQVTPAPYPPNSIKQNITVIPGVPLEFSMDICVNRTTSGNNADAGTFWVEVGGIEIARVAFGTYNSLEFARATLTSQFVHPTGGQLDLEIFMARTFLGTTGTPRARVTNISVQIATGPTFTFSGTRKLGTTRTIGIQGEANQLAGMFIALGRQPGLTIPGISGSFVLDPVTNALFFWSVLNGSGTHTQPFSIPADPNLLSLVAWVQGVQLAGGTTPTLGYEHFLQFNQ